MLCIWLWLEQKEICTSEIFDRFISGNADRATRLKCKDAADVGNADALGGARILNRANIYASLLAQTIDSWSKYRFG